MPEIGIKEFLRLLQTYTKNFSMENEVLSALCSQAINLKNEFSDFQLQLTFQCLTSMHAEPSFINQLDNVIFEKIEGMNIWSAAIYKEIGGGPLFEQKVMDKIGPFDGTIRFKYTINPDGTGKIRPLLDSSAANWEGYSI